MGDHAVAHVLFPGGLDIPHGDVRDPFPNEPVQRLLAIAQHVEQNHQFGHGVVPLQVEGDVGFGIAVFNGFLDRSLAGLVLLHLGQNEVGGHVEQAPDLQHLIGTIGSAQEGHQRRAVHHRGAEQVTHAVGLGQVAQLLVIECRRSLVAGHHVLAQPQRLADIAGGGLTGLQVGVGALEHHVGLAQLQACQRVQPLDAGLVRRLVVEEPAAVLEDGQNLADLQARRGGDGAVGAVAHRYQLEGDAVSAGQLLPLLPQDRQKALAHVARSDERDLDIHWHHLVRRSGSGHYTPCPAPRVPGRPAGSNAPVRTGSCPGPFGRPRCG